MKPADGRHLHDDQLIAAYAGAESKLGRRKQVTEHLRACPECAGRFATLVDELAGLRGAAQAEADAVFTPARLDAQRAHILARLSYVGHPARVIKFPARGSQSLSIFTGNQVRRWTAAAAVAGLVIGVTVGRLTHFAGFPAPRASQVASQPVPRPVSRPVPESVRVPTDDELLSNIDRPLYLQPVAELETLDALTPRPREIALRLQ